MSLKFDDVRRVDIFNSRRGRSGVVVAGPGSSLTVPGIVVSEITQALSRLTQVTRIEVEPSSHLSGGLHRAPSLAVALDSTEIGRVVRYRAPTNTRLREQAFRHFVGPEIAAVVAYAWPGLDNSWIRQIIRAGRSVGALTVVACASLPQPNHKRASSLADILTLADIVIVGDELQATELRQRPASTISYVEVHPALSLSGRSGRSSKQLVTAFLPKNDTTSLVTLLAAFDAVPQGWIDDYHMQIVMKFADRSIPELVKSSFHNRNVDLISDDMTTLDLQNLAASSSALGIAIPTVDSRAFSLAMDCGIGTVVLGNSLPPTVGHSYVGGLLAIHNRRASVHVALIHALRLSELKFPLPSSWGELAARIAGVPTSRPILVRTVALPPTKMAMETS